MPLLPHHDPDLSTRRRAVRSQQNRLRYSHHLLPGIPMADRIPRQARFSMAFYSRVLQVRAARKINRALRGAATGTRELLGEEELIPQERSIRERLRQLRDLPDRLRAPPEPEGAAESIEDFARMFTSIPAPEIVRHYRDDLSFAWQRIAGANPLVLRRIDALPPHFPVAEWMLRAAAGPRDRLAAAAAERRLFLADYALLDGLESAVDQEHPKYLSAPMALFVWRRNGPGRPAGLVPVAIQCHQDPGTIFTPRDGMRWLMARTMVQIADGHIHELISHLTQTHLVMERITIATERCFDDAHPIKILMRPHQEFTLHINATARNNLLAAGGDVQKVLATTLEAALSVVQRAVSAYRFDEHRLPAVIARTGIDALPQHPYRDDGLLIWGAIRDFVGHYLRLYYLGDQEVVADEELRCWLEELSSPRAGQIQGIGPVTGIDDLCAVLTQAIFTASAQHSAVNMSQFAFFGYVPNTPGAAYAPPPGPETANTLARYLSMLPPIPQAQAQLDTIYELSAVQVNRLGDYRLEDPRVQPVVAAFQRQLADIEQTIAQRNRTRLFEYPFLLPSQIAASIHI